MEDGQFVDKATAWDKLAEKNAEIARLKRGIRKIREYLEAPKPRIGDALFDCDALLID